jgi:hypothetical protein
MDLQSFIDILHPVSRDVVINIMLPYLDERLLTAFAERDCTIDMVRTLVTAGMSAASIINHAARIGVVDVCSYIINGEHTRIPLATCIKGARYMVCAFGQLNVLRVLPPHHDDIECLIAACTGQHINIIVELLTNQSMYILNNQEDSSQIIALMGGYIGFKSMDVKRVMDVVTTMDAADVALALIKHKFINAQSILLRYSHGPPSRTYLRQCSRSTSSRRANCVDS